jgi:hypothetical protein
MRICRKRVASFVVFKNDQQTEAAMRFMVLMYPGQAAERGEMPDPKIMAEMGNFNEELVKSGILLAGEGLHPTKAGARVRFQGGKPKVQDGPFTESKEIVGGFWIWQVKSKEEALEWAKRIPVVGDEMVELRRVYEVEDFGDAIPPEVKEQEERLRKQSAAAAQKS